MKLTKYINFKAFLISFSIGLLYIYLTDDYKKIIVVYPTPMNKDNKVYVDKANNCLNIIYMSQHARIIKMIM